MRSRTTRRFREAFSRLPEPVKDRAREAYRRFAEDPDHPGLRFKRVHPTEPIYSVRITRGYRALGIREDEIVWFCIGSHADYDTLVSRLWFLCQPNIRKHTRELCSGLAKITLAYREE